MKYFINCVLFLLTSFSLYSQCPGTSLCSICQADLTVTEFTGGNILNGSSTIPGTILAGGSATGDTIVVEVIGCGQIDITVELDFVWEQGFGINWIHGVSFQASDGWSAAEVILPTNDWIFQDTITGACFNQPFGAGYYYDPLGANCGGGDNSSWDGVDCNGFGTFCEGDDAWLTDGEAFDNWGDDCEFNCPEFGFDLSFCPQNAAVVTETLGFFITDDAQSGGWDTDDGCVFDLNFVIKFVPSLLNTEINSCEGECVTLDAGTGCDSYLWSTGETTPSIVVCPLVETIYTLEATSIEGCVLLDTIKVIPEFCCNSFAGELAGNNECPGDPLTVTVSNFQDSVNYDEYILITDESGIILDIVSPNSVTLNSDVCTTFIVHAYNHYTLDASPVPVIGDDVNTYDCINNCCDLVPFPVSFEDDEAPVFNSPPANEQFDCINDLQPAGDLDWTDNCGLTGIAPIQNEINDATLCDGGNVERTWMAIDSCGNETIHTQTISIQPLAPPVFLNPPSDEVHQCDYTPVVPDLMWENGLTGMCETSGTESGQLSGSHDFCGGSYTILWEHTDQCNQYTSYTQTITVDPAPEASFLNVPADITFQCETIPSSFPDLDYTNGETGVCEISGTEQVVTTGTYDICGGVLMNTWEYTDNCGRVITETQQVTIDPASEAVFLNLPTDITVECDVATDVGVDLFYENGLVGTCEISGSVQPTTSGSFDMCGGSIVHDWEFIDLCGRPINHSQTITVNPAPEAVFINPPADITVACGAAPSTSTVLSYSNGISGDCEIAGDVMGVLSAFDPCTSTMSEQWDFTDLCGNPLSHTRTITVDDLEPIEFENVPAAITVNCTDVDLNIMDLNFSNNGAGVCLIEGTAEPIVSGTYDACGGTLTVTWETTDVCGTLYSVTQEINVEPAPEASFTNVPSDQSISCQNLNNPPSLTVTNGLSGTCLISDVVTPSIQENFDACGGNIVYTWMFTDDCGRSISATQTITITEAPAPAFTNPPQDITIECNEVDVFINFLNYSNNESPPCLLSGNGIAIETGTYDLCGGSITQDWSETDICGNLLTYQRVITINPAPPAVWLNPPEDITLNCGQEYTPPVDLIYSNGEIGTCAIQGTEAAVVVQNGDVYTHEWTFVNPCGAGTIEHTQIITVSPDLAISVDPTIIDICLGESFDLGSISITDANGQSFDVEYYEGFPASSGTEIFDLNVSPTISTLYTIRVFNDLDCEEEILITVNVDEPPFAGDDNIIELCVPGVVNLVELLGSSADPGGIWEDLDGANVNLDNPFAIVIGSQPPGLYQFSYTVESGNTCPSDEAIISIDYFELMPIEIDTIYCTNNNTTYTVELQSFGALILSDAGNVQDLGGGLVIITDIPIDVSVSINNLDPDNLCAGFINVNPPNCDCPSVEAPTGIGAIACESDDVAVLYGEHDVDLILHWYENEDDDLPILSGVDSLIIDNLTQGIYTYYIETESIEFPGCFSPFLTAVTLEVVGSPPLTNPELLEYCLDASQLPLMLDLTSFNTDINGNLDNSFTYYETLEEAFAQNGGFSSISLNASDSVYVSVTSLFGCTSILGFEIIINENPQIEISIEPAICIDDLGTVVLTSPDNPDNYQFILDDAVIEYPAGLADLDAGEYELILIHNTTNCSDTSSFSLDNGSELNIESITFLCDNNETGTDSEDDFYTITFEVSNSDVEQNEFEVFFDGVSQGTFSYNVIHNLNVNANGNEIEIEFVDIITGCSVDATSFPLTPCSTNCELIADIFEASCSNNSTESDPFDDIITFNLLVSSINGSTDNTYVVLINNIASFVFEYGIESSFELPADSTIPSIVLVDSEDNQCQLILDVDPLNPCSAACMLTIENVELECFNNGTEDVFDDDFYSVDIDVLVINGISTNEVSVIVDAGNPVIYDLNNISFDLPADGMIHSIIVQDLDSLMCSDTIEVGPLINCSSPCSVLIDFFDFDCDDNDTSTDPDDDFVTLTWTISSVDGSSNNMYQVYIDDELLGVYSYGITITEIINDLTGEEIVIDFIDDEFQSCFNSETLVLESCSNDCEISAELLLVECVNNETNNTSDDDQFFVDLAVSGINVSENWMIDGQTELYEYNSTIQIGPFDIIDGDILLIIIDSENVNCPFTLNISAPETCSECTQMVEAGDSIEINCDNNNAELIGISSSAGIYSWSGPQGFITSDSLAISGTLGWHYFEANYSDGCSAIDSVLIFSEEDIPTAIGGPDTLLTCFINLVELQGTYVGDGDISVYWEDVDGNVISNEANLEVTSSGFYYFFVVNNETGCVSAPDEVFVGLNIEEPEAIIFADPDNTLDCKVDLITLSYENQINVVYEWSYENETSLEATFEIDSIGTVILMALDTITGCISIDSVDIQELEEFPIINIGPIDIINCEQTEVILDASSSIPFSTSTFQWSNMNGDVISTDPSISVIDSGQYILLVTDTISGCENMDTLQVLLDMDMPDLQVPNDLTFNCTESEATLAVTASSLGVFSWTTINGNITSATNEDVISVNSPGLYIVSFIDENSLCEVLDTIEILEEFNELALDNWEVSDETCFEFNDGNILFGNVTGGEEPYVFELNEEIVNQNDIFDLAPGNYDLLITDADGCVKDTSFTIAPAIDITISDDQIIDLAFGEDGGLFVTTNIPASDIDTIIWSPNEFLECTNCLINSTSTLEDITYMVTIIDVNGCEITTTIEVRINSDIGIYAPNVITNNGDGINDKFTIFTNEELIISELAIYNRWGERVFYTENIPTNQVDLGWDGSFKGEMVNPGVFAFYAIVLLPDNGGEEKIVGDVTVLK